VGGAAILLAIFFMLAATVVALTLFGHHRIL